MSGFNPGGRAFAAGECAVAAGRYALQQRAAWAGALAGGAPPSADYVPSSAEAMATNVAALVLVLASFLDSDEPTAAETSAASEAYYSLGKFPWPRTAMTAEISIPGLGDMVECAFVKAQLLAADRHAYVSRRRVQVLGGATAEEINAWCLFEDAARRPWGKPNGGRHEMYPGAAIRWLRSREVSWAHLCPEDPAVFGAEFSRGDA